MKHLLNDIKVCRYRPRFVIKRRQARKRKYNELNRLINQLHHCAFNPITAEMIFSNIRLVIWSPLPDYRTLTEKGAFMVPNITSTPTNLKLQDKFNKLCQDQVAVNILIDDYEILGAGDDPMHNVNKMNERLNK